MEPLVPFKNKKKKTSTGALRISRAVSTVPAVFPKSVSRAITSVPSVPRPAPPPPAPPPSDDRIPFTLPPIQWKPPQQVKSAVPPRTVSRARTSIPSVPEEERAPFTLPPRANLSSFTIPKKSSSKSEKKTSPIMANPPKTSQKLPKPLLKEISKKTSKEDSSQKATKQPKKDFAPPKAQKAQKIIVPMKKRSIVPCQALKVQKAVTLKIVVPKEEHPMLVMPAMEAPWIPMPVKEAPTVTVPMEDPYPMETMDISNDSASDEPWYAVEEKTEV